MSPQARDGGVHTLKALAVIVVVVLIGWLVLAKSSPSHSTSVSSGGSSHNSSRTTLPTVTLPPATTTTTLVPVANIKLQVLNGVGTGSLAGEWSTKLSKNPGYDTLAADDATAKVAQSEIYIITPGYQGEADALAATVGLSPSRVNPTVPAAASAPIRASERAKANLVLVIGPDLASTA